MEHKFKNFIGGKEINLSGKYFSAKSEFYDYSIELSDAGAMDISVATSKAKKANEALQKLSFDQRIDILKKLSKKIKITHEEIKYNVMMTGMPIKNVSDYIEKIPLFFSNIPEMIKKKYEATSNKEGKQFFKGIEKYEQRIPLQGPTYCVTPANDARISSLIFSISVSLGIPIIIKTSKADAPITLKIARELVEAGYPAEAINVLTYDTSTSEAASKNFRLVDGSEIIWVFGDDQTVDSKLRFETKKYFDIDNFMLKTNVDYKKDLNKFSDSIKKNQELFEENIISKPIDHFSSKTVLRHASGRSAGILDLGFDIEEATKLILGSSIKYPIGCNSLKSLHVVGDAYEKILPRLKKEFANAKIGDPLNQKTNVGYVNKETLNHIEKRVNELKMFKLLNVESEFKRISDIQATPLLCSTNDVNSEFLSKEHSAYVLCLKKATTFDQALQELKIATGDAEKLAVSVLTKNKKVDHTKIHAHHIKINDFTTEVDAIIHEGNDYVMQLTKPKVIHKRPENRVWKSII